MNNKIKVSIYLTDEYRKKLNKLYTDGINNSVKKTYGEIISDAIDIVLKSQTTKEAQ